MRVALRELEGEVGGEQTLVVLGEIGELRGEFECGLVGDVLGGPDLAVGMGIAGAHHGAAVLEDLDVLDLGARAELCGLAGPHLDDAADGGDVHGGEGEVVAGIEAEDAAEAALGFGAEEAGVVDVESGCGNVGLERGEVVFEDVGAGVRRGVVAAGAGVAGAEIAGGVVGQRWRLRGVLGLALPGALGAMRRDDDPLALEGIPAAVRGLLKDVVDHARSCVARQHCEAMHRRRHRRDRFRRRC